MTAHTDFPWIDFNSFLLSVGSADSISEFMERMLTGLQQLIPFDEGLAYVFDENGSIREEYLLNMDPRHSNVYRKYYSRENDLGIDPNKAINLIDWSKAASTEFVRDYIKWRKLRYSLDFLLRGPQGNLQMSVAMDRLQGKNFSEKEERIIRTAVPHLTNLIQKYYLRPNSSSNRTLALMEMAGLTKRECEITELLCRGVSPAEISKRTHIAPTTTYKHIARIYEKFQVSNIQEMLVYLLNPLSN